MVSSSPPSLLSLLLSLSPSPSIPNLGQEMRFTKIIYPLLVYCWAGREKEEMEEEKVFLPDLEKCFHLTTHTNTHTIAHSHTHTSTHWLKYSSHKHSRICTKMKTKTHIMPILKNNILSKAKIVLSYIDRYACTSVQ